MQSIKQDEVSKLRGQIICEKPNSFIYKFEGCAKLEDQNAAISLSADNILLRGMSLRNTEYLYGIVVFTGHDTKIMKNSS